MVGFLGLFIVRLILVLALTGDLPQSAAAISSREAANEAADTAADIASDDEVEEFSENSQDPGSDVGGDTTDDEDGELLHLQPMKTML